MTGETIKSMTAWVRENLGDLLVSAWPEDNNNRFKKEYDLRILTEKNLTLDTPLKVRRFLGELPSDAVLVDLVLYGWQNGKGVFHVVYFDKTKNIFDYFKQRSGNPVEVALVEMGSGVLY